MVCAHGSHPQGIPKRHKEPCKRKQYPLQLRLYMEGKRDLWQVTHDVTTVFHALRWVIAMLSLGAGIELYVTFLYI